MVVSKSIELGEMFKEVRIVLDYTVKEFAEELGIRSEYVCRIEKGHRRAPLKYLDKIMSIFDIPETEVVTLKAWLQEEHDIPRRWERVIGGGEELVFSNVKDVLMIEGEPYHSLRNAVEILGLSITTVIRRVRDLGILATMRFAVRFYSEPQIRSMVYRYRAHKKQR